VIDGDEWKKSLSTTTHPFNVNMYRSSSSAGSPNHAASVTEARRRRDCIAPPPPSLNHAAAVTVASLGAVTGQHLHDLAAPRRARHRHGVGPPVAIESNV